MLFVGMLLLLLLLLVIPLFHYKLTHVLTICCYGCGCFVDMCLVSRPWLAASVAWWCRFGDCVNLVNECPSVFDLDAGASTAATFCADQSEFFVRSFVGAQSGMCGYEPPMLAAQGGADSNAATETPWYAHYSFVAPMAVVGGVLVGVMAATIAFKKVAGARKAATTESTMESAMESATESATQNGDQGLEVSTRTIGKKFSSFEASNPSQESSDRQIDRRSRHDAMMAANPST